MTKPKSHNDKALQAPARAAAPISSGTAAKLSEYIGRELRSMFDGVVAEPVPDKFRKFLEELEKKQARD